MMFRFNFVVLLINIRFAIFVCSMTFFCVMAESSTMITFSISVYHWFILEFTGLSVFGCLAVRKIGLGSTSNFTDSFMFDNTMSGNTFFMYSHSFSQSFLYWNTFMKLKFSGNALFNMPAFVVGSISWSRFSNSSIAFWRLRWIYWYPVLHRILVSLFYF